jgi:hypothetical protein
MKKGKKEKKGKKKKREKRQKPEKRQREDRKGERVKGNGQGANIEIQKKCHDKNELMHG